MAAEDGVQLPVSTMEGEKEEKELPPEAPRMSVDKLLNEEKKRAELLAEERQETMQNTFRVEKIKELTKGNSTSKDGENISRSSLLAEVAGEENGSSPQVYEAKEMLNETSKEESNKKLISEVDLGFQDVETATKEASSLGTQQNAGEESRGKNKDEESNLHSQGAASAESAVVVNHVPDLTRDINLDTRGFSVTRNEDEDKENTLNITTAYFTGDQPETICHRKEEKDSEISSILKSTKVDLEGLTSVVHGEARANKESLSSLARVVSVETECESSVSEAKEEKFQTGNLLIAPSVKDKSIWTAESADKNQEAKSTNDKAEEKILKLNMSDHDSENVSISSYSGNPQKQDEQEETEIGASAEQLKSPLVAELTEETISEDIGPDRVEELEARAGTAFEKEIQETIKLHENTEELTPNKFENQGKNNSKSSPITETQTSSCNKPASTMRIPSMASVLAMENQPALEHKTTLLEEVVVKSRDIESYKVEERSDSRFDQPIMKQDDNLQKESEELALTEVLMSEERVGEVSRGSSEDNIVAEEPIKPGIFNNEKDPEDIFPINELGKENHNESFQLEKTALDQHSERVTSEEQRSIEDLQDNLDEGNTRASKTGNIKAKDTQQEKNVSTIGSTEKAYSTVLYNTVKDTHETGRCPESAVSEELSTAGVSSLELTLTTEVEAGKLERAKQNLQVSNDRGNMEEEMQQQDEEKDDRDNIEEKMQQQDEVPLKEHSASQSSSDKETKLKESLTVRNSKPVRPKEEQDGMKSDETKGNSSEEVASELTEPDDMNNDETEGNSLEEAVTKEEPDDTGSIKTVCPKKESQEMTDDDTKGYTSEEVASEPKEPDDTNNDETTGNSSEEVVSKQPDETGSIKTVCPKEPDEMNDDETKGNSLEEVASELKDDQRNGTEMETDTIIDEIRTEEVYHNTQAEQKETQILDRQQGVTGYLVESSNEESSVEEKTKANQEVETEKIEPKAADASAGKRDLLEEKESQNKPQASVYDETIADNCEGENIVTQNMKEDCGDKNKFTAFVTGMEKEDSREEKEKRESDTEKIPQGQEREKKIARETKSSGDSYPKSLEEEIIQETFQEDEEKMHIIAGAKMSKEESLNPTIPISLVAEGSVEGNSTKEQDVMKLEKERKDRDTEGTGQNYEATDYADDGKMETLKHEGDTNVLGDTDSRTVSAESAKELPPREYEELAQHNSVPKGSERSKEETVDTEESTGILATEEKEVKLKEEMQFDSYTPTSEKMDQVATKTNETEADDINSRSKHQHVSNLEENEDMKVLAAEGNGKEGTRAIIEQEQQYDIHDKLLESEHHKAIGGTFSHDTLEQNAEDPSNLPFDKQNIVTEACKEIDESPEKYEDEEVQKPIGGEEFSRNTESDSNQCFNTDEQELQLKTEEHAHQMEESENNMSNNMVEQESEHHKAIGEAVVHDTLEQNAEDPSNLPFDRQNIVTTEACKKLDESPEKSEGFSISTGAHTALELAEDTEVQKPTGGGEEFPGDPESDSNQCFNTDEQEHHSKTEEQARQIEDSESNNTSSTVEKESEDQAIGGALSHDTLEQNAEDPFDLPFNKQNIATTEASKKIDESPEKSEGFLITTEALSEVDLAEHTEVQNLTRGGEEFSGDTESNSNQCFNSDERELHLKAEEHAHQTENSESNNTSNTVEKESEDQAIGGALSHDTLEQNAEDPFDLPFNKQNIVTTEACKNIDESPEKSEGFCITTEALSAAKIADDTEVQKHTGGEEFSGNTESDSNQCFNTDEQELQLKAEEHARQIENSESNNTSNMVEKESEDQAIGGALSHDTLEQNAEDQLDFPFNKQNIVTTEASKKIDESPEISEGFRITTEALSEVELAEHTEVQKPTGGGEEFSGDTESNSNQCFNSDERELQLKAEERAHQTENSESNNTSNTVEKESEDQAIGGALSHDTLEQNAEDLLDLPFNKQNIVTTEAPKKIDESPEKSEGFRITTEALSEVELAEHTEVQKPTGGGEEFSGDTESNSNQCFNSDEQDLQLKAEEHAHQIENSESNNTSNTVEKESEDQAIGGALSHDTLEQNAEDQLDFPFNKQNIVTTEASKKIDESPEKSEGFRINTEALSEVELAEHTEVQKPTGGKEFSGDTESDSNQCFSSDERNLQLKAEERAHQTENSESNNTSNTVEKESEDQAIGGALSHYTLEQNAEDQLDFPFNKQNIVTTEASKKIDESPEKSEGFHINTEALSEVELAEHTEVQKPTGGGEEFSGDTESDSNQCFNSDERELQLKAEERAHQIENSESNNTSNMVEKGSVFLQSPEELPSASELIAEECNNRSNPKSRMATVQEGSQSIKDQNTESIKEQNFLDCQSETNEGQELISEAKELIDEKPKTNEKAMEAFLTDEATQVLVGAERLVECENIMEKIKEEKMPEQKLQSSPEETYYGSVPNQISEGQHSNKTTQDANLTKELDQETGPTDTSAAKALGKIEIADMVTKTTELVKEDSYLQESQMPAQANATVNEANDPQLSPVKDLCTGCAATSGETTETVIMKGVEATLWEGKGLLITKESEEQRGKNEKLADVTSLASQATEDNVIKSETFIHADELCENINISRRLEKEEGRRLEEVRVYDKSLQAIETYLGDKPETIEETQSAHSEVDGDKLGDISALVSQVQTTESDIADKRIIISETSDLNENEAAGKAIADQVHKLQDQGIEQLLESKGIQTVIQNNADKVEEHISNGIESKSAAKCESPEAVVEANLAPIQSNPEPAVVDEVEETSFTVLPKEEDHKISDGIENKKGQSAKIDEYTVNETSNSSLVTIPGEEFLQKGIQASESDSKGIAIEAVEKEDRDTETPKLKPKEYVTEMGFSDPSAVKCEKNMELGLVEKSKDEENLKSENINKVDDQLTISNSAVKDDPSHKVSQKYEEAADPAAPGKFLDAVPEDGNTEEFFKAEKIDINKKLETATTGTREEEILIEESKKTKQTSWNDHSFKISNENTGAEDSCHGSPDEEISQRIYQEDELKPEVYPRVQINEISENAKNTRQSEKKQMPSEDKTVEEPCQDSPPEETVTDSPEEEEKEGKNVEDTTSLLELQEKADKLNSGKTGNEVKIANEKVEDSEITSPKIDEDSQRSNDQDNIVEKDSEVTNTNTCFAPVIDDVNSRESPENSRGYVVSEAEPVEAVNEAIEDCEKNEDDAKTVTSNLSLIDCESPHYSPNESSCNISNVTRGLNLESQEQYAEKSAIPEDDKSKEIEKTEECLLIADKESTEEVCTTAQERSSKDDEKQQEAKEQVKLSTSTRGMKPCGDDIPARTTESEDTIFHDKDENYNGQLMDQEPTTRQILAEAELQSLNASKVVPEDKKTGDECKEIMGKSTSMTLDPTSESNLVDGAKEDSLQVADDPCEDSCIKIAHKDAPINLTKANDNTDEIHKPIESPIRISDLEILTKPDPRIAMGTKLPSGQKEFPQMLHSPMDGTLQQEIENSEAAVEGERGAECLESKKLNPDCKDRIESFKPTTSAESSPSNLQQSTKRTEQKQDDGETEDQHENLLAISQINTSTLTEKTNQDPVNVSSALDAKIPLGMQKLEVDSFSVLGKHIAAQADPSGSSTSQMSTLELQQNAIGDNPEPAKVEPEEATCVEEKGISEEAISKSILMETRTSLSETLEMPKRAISQVTRDFIAESDQEVQKEELKERKKTIIEHEEPKTDEDKEEEVEGEEEKRRDSAYDIPVTVKAPRDIDVKVAHKKSHNILAGVGSKVKHSIAKVKKAITGKSSHPKPPSPK